MEKGFVGKIQRYSTKDGPGIRTTVFMKGCNLRCKWCSNPELISKKQSYMDEEPVGKYYTSNELLDILIRDKSFYDYSNGGVTFSGGDPLLQGKFLFEIIKKLKEEGIKVAIDTALYFEKSILEKFIGLIDLWLVDLKTLDSKIHKTYTGVDNKKILDNINYLDQNKKKMRIRCVMVNDVNASISDLKNRLDYIYGMKSIKRVDVLGYHNLGEAKYQKIGMEYYFDSSARLGLSKENEIRELISSYDFEKITFEKGL